MQQSRVIGKYIAKLSILFVIMGAISAVVFVFAIPQHYFSLFPFVLAYFFLLNFFSYLVLIKTHGLPVTKFYRIFTMMSTVKFLFSLIVVVLYIIFCRETLYPFLATFIILYFHSLFQVVRDFQSLLPKKSS